jgi:prolyl 4-hydroxylase
MFAYILGAAAVAIFWLGPALELFSPSSGGRAPLMRRGPRPRLDESLLALDDSANLTCPPDAYAVHIYSKAPLVLYLENFLSAAERRHLLEIRLV